MTVVGDVVYWADPRESEPMYLFGMQIITSPWVPDPRQVTTEEFIGRYVRHRLKAQDRSGALRGYDPGPEPYEWDTVLTTVYVLPEPRWEIPLDDMPEPTIIKDPVYRDTFALLRHDWLMRFYPPPRGVVIDPYTALRITNVF